VAVTFVEPKAADSCTVYVPAGVPAVAVGDGAVASFGPAPAQAARSASAPTHKTVLRRLRDRQSKPVAQRPKGISQRVLGIAAADGAVVVTIKVEPFTAQEPIGIEQDAEI
jgi:hypothetical protein